MDTAIRAVVWIGSIVVACLLVYYLGLWGLALYVILWCVWAFWYYKVR